MVVLLNLPFKSWSVLLSHICHLREVFAYVHHDAGASQRATGASSSRDRASCTAMASWCSACLCQSTRLKSGRVVLSVPSQSSGKADHKTPTALFDRGQWRLAAVVVVDVVAGVVQ